MSYAAQSDLVARFGETELIQISNETDEETINSDRVSQALLDTNAEIDGYLVGRYALPLATTPPILKGFACDIARYRLYDDRATEQVTKRYDDAIKYLRSVSTGQISLGLNNAGDAPEAPANSVQVQADCRVFSRDRLADY